MCLILSASSWVRRWLKCRTVLQWTRTFSYQRPIKSDAYASKATCKTICHLECVNIWTTRLCHFDWMSLQNAGQRFRSSDRAAVFGVCVGRWSDRSRYNWLTIDQDGGSLGNSPSPHVVSPLPRRPTASLSTFGQRAHQPLARSETHKRGFIQEFLNL